MSKIITNYQTHQIAISNDEDFRYLADVDARNAINNLIDSTLSQERAIAEILALLNKKIILMLLSLDKIDQRLTAVENN